MNRGPTPVHRQRSSVRQDTPSLRESST